MDESFFIVKETKCSKCPLSKKPVKKKHSNSIVSGRENPEIIVVVPMAYSNQVNAILENTLERKKLLSYKIVMGLQCETTNQSLPSPIHAPYKACNTCSEKKIGGDNLKVVLTFGAGLKAITQNDDIGSWHSFKDVNDFNPKYFITGHSWKQKVRVYPMPDFIDCSYEGFSRYIVNTVLREVKQYLADYTHVEIPAYDIVTIDEPNQFLKDHMNETVVAWDIETSSLNHFADTFEVGTMQMTFDGNTAYFMDYKGIDKPLLDAFFKDKHQILAYGKYDCKATRVDGSLVNAKQSDDVTLLFHALSTERMSNSIKALAWFIGFGGYEDKLEDYKKKYKITNYLDIELETLKEYAALDAIVTYRLWVLGKELASKQRSVYKRYKSTLLPVVEVFQEMELKGMYVDKNILMEIHGEFNIKIDALEVEIKKEVGNINISSNDQLGRKLEEMGLPLIERNKKGIYKVNKESKQLWSMGGYKIADLLLEFTKYKTLDSTFVGEADSTSNEEINIFDKKSKRRKTTKKKKKTGLIHVIDSDGLAHTNYSGAMADSFRTKSSNPNLQNIPARGTEAMRIREAFTLPEDYLFWGSDYDGIQLRIAQIMSGDETMFEIFTTGGSDMHSITAHSVFTRNITIEEFKKRLASGDPLIKSYRTKAKAVNFGFLFGLSAFSFAMTIQIEWSQKDVDEYITLYELELLDKPGTSIFCPFFTIAVDIREKFFLTYKRIPTFINNQHIIAAAKGYIPSMVGLNRHLSELKSSADNSAVSDNERRLRNNLRNISINSPIQSFEAVLIYDSMIKIHQEIIDRKMKSSLRFMVHDEIGGYVHKSEIEEIFHIVKDAMEDHTTYDIPLTAGINFGTLWGYGDEVTDETLAEYINKVNG